ncbi:MAG: hypothetical protein JXL81_01655 [Deltaproteobacteria bacterium]|nr:hypothetical protein [Deltaproteobacteria bacterium]
MAESSYVSKIIIDESIPENRIGNIQNLLKRKRIEYSDFCFITREHPGMPDYQVIHFLLNEHTVLFTCDRPLHNTVLKKGYKSFYYNGDNFSAKPLKGISTIKMPGKIKKDLKPQASYLEPGTDIRNLVLPKTEKGLKKLRTKRRRIRSYFGGTENMDLVAITVSYKPVNASALIGVRIKISSNTGLKALDASESYIMEKTGSGNSEIIAVSHALMAAVQLMLNNVKTILYYDTQRFQDPACYIQENTDQPDYFILGKLLENFSKIEFAPSAKGFFIERLRRKLEDLMWGNTNEIVPGRYFEIESGIKEFYSKQNQE